MSKLLIRHAEPDLTGPLHDEMDPSLSSTGFRQADALGIQLRAEGVDVGRVAVSEALRTYDTARSIGAKGMVIYPLLNGVPHEGMSKQEVRDRLQAGWLPTAALDTARNILEDPPAEDIIVTHGLVIAGLTAVVRLNQGLSLEGYPLCPEHCGTRELNI
jgi:broad specificity phosphatase PhoE